MAEVTINVNAQSNNPPSQVGNNSFNLNHKQTYIITVDDLTTNTIPEYLDPEGDDPENLRVSAIPSTGELQLSASAVSVNDIIPFTSIAANNLIYVAEPTTETAYTDTATFEISDVGSSTYSSGSGTLTFNVLAKVNEPPTIGDNEDTMDYGDTYVFDTAFFTTGTTPAYSDPEGDAAYLLQIKSLPVGGTLWFNGKEVIINQEILFTDIDAGLLYLTGDLNQTEGQILTFEADIQDAGSGQYSS